MTIGCGLGADLTAKHLAFEHVWIQPIHLSRDTIISNPEWNPPSARREVIPHVLDLRLVLNRGAVFGIGPGQRWFFVAFTFIAIAVGVYVFALRVRSGDVLLQVAIGTVLAGALGNLYDRIMFGAVRDFLNIFPGVHLPFGLHWPGGGSSEVFPWVFNIADMLLLTGIGLLMIRLNQRAAAPDESSSEDATATSSASSAATMRDGRANSSDVSADA